MSSRKTFIVQTIPDFFNQDAFLIMLNVESTLRFSEGEWGKVDLRYTGICLQTVRTSWSKEHGCIHKHDVG